MSNARASVYACYIYFEVPQPRPGSDCNDCSVGGNPIYCSMRTVYNYTTLLENIGENVKIPFRCTCHMLGVVSVADAMFPAHHTNGTTKTFHCCSSSVQDLRPSEWYNNDVGPERPPGIMCRYLVHCSGILREQPMISMYIHMMQTSEVPVQ